MSSAVKEQTCEPAEDGVLQLEVFMEEDTFYIRSMLNGCPVFEIEGQYEEELVKNLITAISSGTLSDQIMQLFEGFDDSVQPSGVVCTVYDKRSGKDEHYTVQLFKESLANQVLISDIALSCSDPLHNVAQIRPKSVC